MKIAIVSPGLYPYGALVIGGVLKDKGHKVSLFNELDPRTISGMNVVGLSLTSTLHLLSAKEFVSRFKFGLNPPFIGGQLPELVFSHLFKRSLSTGPGRSMIAPKRRDDS
jgi:hypothetical protein